MGSTLTHGVYLPDEGERNCYNGLAGNWTILDNSVGTVAEHTTALAGKAPAVHTHTKSDVTDLLNSNFIPSANNSYDLGSSSYQWNNLYASKIKQFDSFSSYADVYQVLDSSNNRIVSFRITKGATKNTLGINVHDQNNSAPKGLVIENDLSNNITITGGGTNNYLGTSTNKWKSLNGINPGALSLPDYDDTTYIDISGSIIPPSGETTINKNLGDNTYTPPVDGWLSIRCDGASYLQIYRSSYNCPGVTSGDGTPNIKLVVTLPVRKNVTYTIRISKTGAGVEYYQLYPCLGNV